MWDPNDQNKFSKKMSSFQEAEQWIPSIYVDKKNHMTWSEWADKAAVWTKTKQQNEAYWNVFGVPPAPQLNIDPYSCYQAPFDYGNVDQSQHNILKYINDYTSYFNQVPSEKKKLVPNWIKSKQLAAAKKASANSAALTNSDIIDEETAKKNADDKIEAALDKIAEKYCNMIINEITDVFIQNIRDSTIEQVVEATKNEAALMKKYTYTITYGNDSSHKKRSYSRDRYSDISEDRKKKKRSSNKKHAVTKKRKSRRQRSEDDKRKSKEYYSDEYDNSDLSENLKKKNRSKNKKKKIDKNLKRRKSDSSSCESDSRPKKKESVFFSESDSSHDRLKKTKDKYHEEFSDKNTAIRSSSSDRVLSDKDLENGREQLRSYSSEQTVEKNKETSCTDDSGEDDHRKMKKKHAERSDNKTSKRLDMYESDNESEEDSEHYSLVSSSSI